MFIGPATGPSIPRNRLTLHLSRALPNWISKGMPRLFHPIRPLGSIRRHASHGFTLIEAALATVVVGVAFVAALQLIATGTAVNVDATKLTTGVNVARGVNEYLLQKKFLELKGF